MANRLRIMVTGFQPFPGAPFNPTMPLVRHLTRLRRPALADVELIGHIFPVSYEAVDQELPTLLAEHRPDALLMFGLATRTPYVRIETRARNAVTGLWLDARHTRIARGTIDGNGPSAMTFGPHMARLLRAAVTSGVASAASRDAGRYLCNYLSWRAIEAVRAAKSGLRLAAFVHVPLVPRTARTRRPGAKHRVTAADLRRVGEALLLETVTLARHR